MKPVAGGATMLGLVMLSLTASTVRYRELNCVAELMRWWMDNFHRGHLFGNCIAASRVCNLYELGAFSACARLVPTASFLSPAVRLAAGLASPMHYPWLPPPKGQPHT
ncbi:hypothetical protein GYMLUDRAFT_242879 [Collybiopsis luxurians FD-317 M1]|uniref:Unplaced genomic scaffold GYMLUscaffold_20, whole genome shotgun sequence n=1 Tax=Collybiopsis luxurians FD-317 M1 TaxID=944289 RepID=A0A0D0C275_9AGAR|nr:hypothetical protein GYMLUDRAFT_242879 [Collybiopsis luxurians FD-317 M1]